MYLFWSGILGYQVGLSLWVTTIWQPQRAPREPSPSVDSSSIPTGTRAPSTRTSPCSNSRPQSRSATRSRLSACRRRRRLSQTPYFVRSPAGGARPLHVSKIQCRHLIPALNAWAARVWYMAERLIDHPPPTCIPGTNDLKTERSFEPQATCVINAPLIFLIFYLWVFGQQGISRRPVDWCRDQFSVL